MIADHTSLEAAGLAVACLLGGGAAEGGGAWSAQDTNSKKVQVWKMITIDWRGKPVGLLGYPPPPCGPSLSSAHPALGHHNRKGQMVECDTLGNLWTLVFPRLRRVWLFEANNCPISNH